MKVRSVIPMRIAKTGYIVISVVLLVILRYRYVEQGSYQFGWYRGKQHSVP